MKTAILAAVAALALPCAAMAQPVESFLEIPTGKGALKATMLRPAGDAPAPLVIILPGSGPTDRDGNSPLGVRGSTYRLLAEGLAADGIASIRMDKRGMFASGAAAENPNAVTVDVLAEDALAWAARGRALTGARCAWLTGHSEGSLVALLAAKTPDGICGLILLSGAGRPLDVVIADQFRANPANAPILDQALAGLATVKAGRTVDTTGMHPGLASFFNPSLREFMTVAMRDDPARLIAAYQGPVLILQGTTDIQVLVKDAELLKAGQPRARLVLLEGVNHLLKAAPADRAANIATYADPSLPLAPQVVPAIAGFIRAQPGTN